MEKITKKRNALASLLAGAFLFFAREARAQERQEFVIPSLTNNVTVAWTNNTGWQKQFYVLARANEGGQVQYEKSNDNFYDEGTNLTISAIPNQYYKFSNWTGINSTNNPLELIVNDVYNLVANFSPTRTQSGTPHLWYASYGITNDFEYHDNNDVDGDGKTGREEYLWGSNPLDENSYPRISAVKPESGGNGENGEKQNGNNVKPLVLSIIIHESYTNRRYFVDGTYSLFDGFKELTNSLGNNGELIFEFNETNFPVFYRGRAKVED